MSARSLTLAAAACALIAAGAHRTPWLIWNATASAPIGFYRVVRSGSFHHGELVLASAPLPVQQFAAARGYLPRGVPLVKHVGAMSGDRICARAHVVTINGYIAATRLVTDRLRRPLSAWQGCQTLTPSSVLLLNADAPQSFDGRYFGPISTSFVIGKLVPLWTH